MSDFDEATIRFLEGRLVAARARREAAAPGTVARLEAADEVREIERLLGPGRAARAPSPVMAEGVAAEAGKATGRKRSRRQPAQLEGNGRAP